MTIDFIPPTELTAVNHIVSESLLPIEQRGATWGFATACLGNGVSTRRMNRVDRAAVVTLSVWATHAKRSKRNPHSESAPSLLRASLRGATASKRESTKFLAHSTSLNEIDLHLRRLAAQMPRGSQVNYVGLFWDLYHLNNTTRAKWTRDIYIPTKKETA